MKAFPLKAEVGRTFMVRFVTVYVPDEANANFDITKVSMVNIFMCSVDRTFAQAEIHGGDLRQNFRTTSTKIDIE